MLDLIRKRAQSWMTIALFGIIILVFVFFFGYSDIGGQGRRANLVAKVGGERISNGEFQIAVENNTAYYREIFKEAIPDPIARGIRPATLQQLINQRIVLDAARRARLPVPPEELAAKIRSLPYLMRNNQFDAGYYREVFLPHMARRYRIDFEQVLADELLVDKFQTLLKSTALVAPHEAHHDFLQAKALWTFEVVTIDPATLVAAKKIARGEEAPRVARELQAAMTNVTARDKLLATYGLTIARAGPMSIAARRQLFGGAAPRAAYGVAFRLTDAQPTPAEPLEVAGKWVALKLVKTESPAEPAWKGEAPQLIKAARDEKGDARIQRWLAGQVMRTTVRRFVTFDES